MKNLFILITLILSTAIACNDQTLEQIQTTHTQNTELEKEMTGIIESLVQIRNHINIQGRALTEEEIALVSKIDTLEQKWLDWETAFQAIEPGKAAKKSRETILKEEQTLLQTLQTLKTEAETLKK